MNGIPGWAVARGATVSDHRPATSTTSTANASVSTAPLRTMLRLPSEEFLDRLDRVVHQRNRSSLRPGQLVVGVEAQGLVQGGRHLTRGDRPGLRHVAQLIRLADDAPALDRAA